MDLDVALTRWLNSFSGHLLLFDSFMIGVTHAGPYILITLITLRWWTKNERIDERHLAMRCGLAAALGLLLNQIILLFIHRVRPSDLGLTKLIVQRSPDPSFPSDHVTLSFAIAVTLLLRRDRWTIPFLAGSGLIAWSRVYVGTHYVSDALGGIMTGAAAAAVVVLFYGRLRPLTDRLARVL